MRFVFAISKLGQNGPSGSRIRLAKALQERGHDASILTFSPALERDIPPGLHVACIDDPIDQFPTGAIGRFRLARSLRRWIRNQENLAPIDFLSSSLTGTDRIFRMAGVSGVRHWIHIATSKLLDDVATAGRRARRRRLYGRLYDGARVIGVSQGVLDDLASLDARPLEADLVYNAFDTARIRHLAAELPSDLPRDSFVLHVGRFAVPKRHDLLFEAFASAAPGRQLVLLTEPRPALTEMIERYGLTSRVTITGFRQNPYPFIAAADVLVLSSDREGFPNVLLESLICGTPVISTDCPAGPSEILTHDYARWLSPPGDGAALAANLSAVLDAPYAIEPWLYERFSIESVLDQLEAIASRGPFPSLHRMKLLG